MTSNSHPITTPSDAVPNDHAEEGGAAISDPSIFALRAPFPPIVDTSRFPVVSALLNEDIDGDALDDRIKLMQCNICEDLAIWFRAPREAMLKHVRAVHTIKTPKADHYSRTSDLQVHVEIHDPDTHSYESESESESDNSASIPHDMDRAIRLCGAGTPTRDDPGP
ncbi:hypothetical protein B0J17DRAFT_723900 [Rhizoctonia solani]|nr:hypothetical protein B0J17DRAFT_723900 [Rhizoctonia solani]